MTRKLWTIPNILSLSRIVFLPLLYDIAFKGHMTYFIISYAILGLTDALDGFLARKLNQVTTLGKILDTVADMLFYFSTLFFMVYFYPERISQNALIIYIFLGFYVFAYLFSFIRFKKPMQLHTNHLRVNAALVYFLMIMSPFMDTTWVITAILVSFIIAYIEEILIFILYGAADVDTRSLRALLKEKKS